MMMLRASNQAYTLVRAWIPLAKIDVRIIVLIGLGIVLSFAGAYRWFGTGWDFPRYAMYYSTLSYEHPLVGSRFEPGYLLTMWFFKFVLRVDFLFFVFVLIAFSLTLKFTLIWKLTKSPVAASIIYACLLYPLHEYSAFRATIAIALAYFALYNALRHKYLLASLFFGLGVLFHFSAIVLAVAACASILFWKHPLYAVFTILGLIGCCYLESDILQNVLTTINPLVVDNFLAINQPGDLRAFATFPLLFYSSVLSSAIFLSPWNEETANVLFFLSALGAVLMITFNGFPIVGARLMELLEMPMVLLAFRVPLLSFRIIPAILISMMATGWCWFSFLGMEL